MGSGTEFWAKAALLFCAAAGAYLLGCVNGAIFTSSVFCHDDVRRHGSGNAGLTNFYRVYGGNYALIVIACDMLKALLAIVIGRVVIGYYLGSALTGAYFAALFCIVGHMFPAFYAFRGGKGILCSGMLLLILDWRIALVGWGLFLLAWLLTRYVSLGSVLAALSFPVTTFFVYRAALPTAISLVIAGLVIFAHRGNIVRLLRGQEHKFEWHRRPTDPQ